MSRNYKVIDIQKVVDYIVLNRSKAGFLKW